MKSILENWNVKYNDIVEVKEDVWSINNDYYLKANRNNNWVSNLQVYKTLGQLGIPVPEVIYTNKGKDYVAHNNKNYFLTRKLEGTHLSKYDVISDITKAHSVGKVIAKLHKAFSSITDRFEFTDNNFMNELNGWVKDNLKKYAAKSFTYGIFDSCITELKLVYDKLQRHLIHRDMHLGNMLFTEGKITGYIDFDLTQINVRIFDIAYILVGWIVGEIHNHRFIDKWKKTVSIVVEGYEDEQRLSNHEKNSLVIMMCCIEILFVAYFYGIHDSNNALKAEECLKWLWNNREDIL